MWQPVLVCVTKLARSTVCSAAMFMGITRVSFPHPNDEHHRSLLTDAGQQSCSAERARCELHLDHPACPCANPPLRCARAVNGGRVNIAACSVGGAAFCLETAQQYASVRAQFGRPIGSFQATQFRLADMATSLHASRLMVRCAVFPP